ESPPPGLRPYSPQRGERRASLHRDRGPVMERTLTAYIRALRQAGAAVSPAEAIDAARAVAIVGYAERETLKDSLGVVLAKTPEEKDLHARLFELYFSRAPSTPSGSPSPSGGGEMRLSPSSGGSTGEAGEGGDPADALVDLANSGDPDRIAVAMERAAAQVGVDEIRFASQGPYFSRRMLEAMGIEALEARLMQRLEARDPNTQGDAKADAQALMDARAALAREARAHVDRRFEVFGRAATETFMNSAVANRAIDKLSLRDMERMKAVVARMARRLAVRHSRRRKIRNRGRLDVRRTLRANAGYDGVPFEVVWKRKHRDRPRIVAVCDVSGSVAAYVRFLLMFLYALQETVADLGAFAFAHELHDVGGPLKRMDFETAMEHILFEIGSGGTDYGQALIDLKDKHWEQIDRHTTVLVLGDGRSNHTDPRLDIFAELADRAKRVVWLCPEPAGRWGGGDSEILKYRPFCTHLSHCATALDLEEALDEILLAYD
ncbi:MAG: hypothetical protein JWO83_2073, partial [Caulobacteraceae bacterium]|nr:hypothetical protein [Caulobacteraceae bacterium]